MQGMHELLSPRKIFLLFKVVHYVLVALAVHVGHTLEVEVPIELDLPLSRLGRRLWWTQILYAGVQAASALIVFKARGKLSSMPKRFMGRQLVCLKPPAAVAQSVWSLGRTTAMACARVWH